MPDDLFDNLLAASNREIYALADKLKANQLDYLVIEPLLHQQARNECKMLRVRYEALVAAGFSPEQSLIMVMNK